MQSPEEYQVSQRIRELIKGLKRQRGMTKKEVCRHLEIGETTLDDYLNGVSSFKLGTLLRFADLCRVKLSDIIDNTDALTQLFGSNTQDKSSIVMLLAGSVAGVLVFDFTALFIFSLLWFYSREDENSHQLTLIYLFTFFMNGIVGVSLNFYLFPVVADNYINNNLAFGSSLFLSALLMALISCRMHIFIWLTKGRKSAVFELNPIDSYLYFLAGCLLFVDVLALLENIVRHLERLGVKEETAKLFWELTFFWDYYEYLKAAPTILCILILFSSIQNRLKHKATNFA